MFETKEYALVCGCAFEDMTHEEMMEFDGGTTPTTTVAFTVVTSPFITLSIAVTTAITFNTRK